MAHFTDATLADYCTRLVNLPRGAHGVEHFETDPAAVRAALYARVSTDGQTDDDRAGLPEQITSAVEHITRMGWQIAAVYWDAYSGAGTKNRRAFQRLCRDTEQACFQKIVARKLNRLGRSLSAGLLLEAAQGAKIDIVTYAEPHNPALAPVLIGISAYDRQNIIDTTRAGRVWKARNGRVGVSAPPFGFRTGDDGRIEKQQGEWELLEELATRVLNGELPRAIATDWNLRGVPSRRPLKRGWEAAHLLKFLRNTIMKGDWQCMGHLVPAPAVVTAEEWDRLRLIIDDRGKHAGRPATNSFALAGLLYCAVCGHTMTGRSRKTGYCTKTLGDGSRKRYKYSNHHPPVEYACSGMKHWKSGCRTPKYVPERRLLPAVFESVYDVTEFPEKHIEKYIKTNDYAITEGPVDAIAELEKERASHQAQIDKLSNEKVLVQRRESAGMLTMDEADDRLRELAAKQEYRREQIRVIETQIDERRNMERIREALRKRKTGRFIIVENLPDDEKIKLVRNHVQRIDLEADGTMRIVVQALHNVQHIDQDANGTRQIVVQERLGEVSVSAALADANDGPLPTNKASRRPRRASDR